MEGRGGQCAAGKKEAARRLLCGRLNLGLSKIYLGWRRPELLSERGRAGAGGAGVAERQRPQLTGVREKSSVRGRGLLGRRDWSLCGGVAAPPPTPAGTPVPRSLGTQAAPGEGKGAGAGSRAAPEPRPHALSPPAAFGADGQLRPLLLTSLRAHHPGRGGLLLTSPGTHQPRRGGRGLRPRRFPHPH